MWNGVMLIVVTMFAVLGAYYLSDLLMQGCARRRKVQDSVVLLAADTPESMWSGVLEIRGKMPEMPVMILCPPGAEMQRLEPGMKGVQFVTRETMSDVLCRALHVPAEEPSKS